MALEDRLFAIIRVAMHGEFTNYGQLAFKVHESGPTEFTYNRLDEKHVMQTASIVPYVSFLHVIGLFEVNSEEKYYCILDEAPTKEGVKELVSRKAIEKLTVAGFTRDGFLKAIKRMLRGETIILPNLREIYQAMRLEVSEAHFIQLTALGGVKAHFGFSLVTRRVILPTQ